MFQILKRRWAPVLAIFILSSCVGCKGIYSDNPNVENAFTRDATFDWVGTVRPKDSSAQTFGYSSKAKAVEQHLLGSK